VEEIKLLNPYIEHVHISDADGVDGEGIQIDEGKMDFTAILSVLRNDAAIIPEIWRGHEHNGEGFKVAFERLKKYG
jgi:N-acetylneuraminate synthase